MKTVSSFFVIALALAACGPKPDAPAAPKTESVTQSVAAESKAPAPKDILSCTYPVKGSDTKASLLARFGKDAELSDINGPEGMVLKGLVLFGKDPKRRIEVILNDENNEIIEGVRLGAEATSWSAADIHLGDSIASVTAKNGKPFDVGGFGWDYGGYAMDYKGGALDHFDKDCSLSLRFDVTGDNVSNDTQGERTLSSNDPKVIAAQAHVTEISIGWPTE